MKRRKFLEITSLGSAALASSLYLPSGSADRKLNIGLIGTGWYGLVDIKAALKAGGVEVIGICDVDSAHLESGADEIGKIQGARPGTFKYFRELLEMKDLEAVFIGTPPHWHALQFIAACEKGLDIYCEKPLAYDIREGMAMVAAAKKAGNIVQIGFQRRQSGAFRKSKEMIESGRIGKVHQINSQINYIPVPDDTAIQAPPASLDWDEWCGPAPKLDYRPSIGHKSWRLEKEYGNGHLVDWGIHHIDIIRVIMNEGMPVEFSSSGGLNVLKDRITTPDTLFAWMKFNNAPVMWQHRLWGSGDASAEFNNGIFFFGEDGSLFAEDSRVIVFDKKNRREELSITTPETQEKHVANFLEAVRKKDKSLISCSPEDAFQSTATVQLAMISYYTGTQVKWDLTGKEVTGNPEASKLLRREYRSGYKHP
jgi:predicted dehydrogenase